MTVAAGVRDAALVGVINILLQPEYGNDWIVNDVLRNVPKDAITDDLIEQVDDLITRKLNALALSVASELPVGVAEQNGLGHLIE
jgi:hypothetical protein